MTTETEHAKKPATAAKPATKLNTIKRLMRRKTGASIAELTKATDWQKHSVHGQLSTLRKKGENIVREKRDNGVAAYFLRG
ncbi:MAG: DUF3489 domain-containing protein [Pacificimonas sp.]|nr:DUF3489 domain-containing protein [Pacificimonas sp.]